MRALASIALSCVLSACTDPAPKAPKGPSTEYASPEQGTPGSVAGASPVEEKKAPQVPFDSWKPSPPAKWAAAMDGYVSAVKPGNQLALGASVKPWAEYLSSIHVKVHPIFADQFVPALRGLPPGNPLADLTLITRVEIVIRDDGTIDRLGIVKGSGVADFDRGVLDSIDRAAPFAPPPPETRSADGRAYLQWELYRDDIMCATINAQPYLLK